MREFASDVAQWQGCVAEWSWVQATARRKHENARSAVTPLLMMQFKHAGRASYGLRRRECDLQ